MISIQSLHSRYPEIKDIDEYCCFSSTSGEIHFDGWLSREQLKTLSTVFDKLIEDYKTWYASIEKAVNADEVSPFETSHQFEKYFEEGLTKEEVVEKIKWKS